MKKYELVATDIKTHWNRTLKRIKALVDIADHGIKVGDLGGYIESEKNLSHENTCWVGQEAKVFGNAEVFENATVFGNATVYDNAKIYGKAEVLGDTCVFEDAEVFDSAKVFHNARIFGKSKIYGTANVDGNAAVNKNAEIFEDARVFGSSWISENAKVYGNSKIHDNCTVFSDARVSYNSDIGGTTLIGGKSKVTGNFQAVSITGLRYIFSMTNQDTLAIKNGDEELIESTENETSDSFVGRLEIPENLKTAYLDLLNSIKTVQKLEQVYKKLDLLEE